MARAPAVGLTDVAATPAVCVLTQLAEAASSAPQTLSPVSILKARKLYDQALTARLTALDQTTRKGSLTHLLSPQNPIVPFFRNLKKAVLPFMFSFLVGSVQLSSVIFTSQYSSTRSRGPSRGEGQAQGFGWMLCSFPVPDNGNPCS